MENPEHHHEPDGLEVFFSKYLKEASMEPSARPWEGIEQALELEKKRRKRFFWIFFGGMGFVAVLLTLYLCTFGPLATPTGNPSAATKNNLPNASPGPIKAPAHIAGALPAKHTEQPATKEPGPRAIDGAAPLKVQLGAFKHKVNEAIFNQLKRPVVAEASPDGLTRYYTEVAGDSAEALEMARRAGFKDAFIKTGEGTLTSHPCAVEPQALAGAANDQRPRAGTARARSFKAAPSRHSEFEKISKAPLSPAGNPDGNAKPAWPNGVPAQNQAAGQPNAALQAAGGAPQKPAGVVAMSMPATGTPGSTEPDSAATAAAPADSAVKQPAKADSTVLAKPLPGKDSLAKASPACKWSLSLTGGPNLFFNTIHSGLFDPSGEKQPFGYGTGITAGYRPFKAFSFSVGIGYAYYVTRQDATYFRFSKHLTSDYTFYTSQGPVNVDKDVMLDGFNTLAPVDTFGAHYSYTSRLSLVNIPLRVNWHFLDRGKFSLYAGAGLNMSYVTSQYAQLDLMKEHVTNHVESRQVRTQKLNAALLLGLGCDVRIRKRWYVTLAPSYTYGLNNASGTPGVLFRPNYFSGHAGLKILF